MTFNKITWRTEARGFRSRITTTKENLWGELAMDRLTDSRTQERCLLEEVRPHELGTCYRDRYRNTRNREGEYR